MSVLLALCLTAAGPPRPNVVVILVDDMGFSDVGCYGGEIETPNIDALAAGGLRFTAFHNSGRCCPTRASLLTGLHPHQTGIGHMTLPPGNGLDAPGPYQGYLNGRCTTLAEVFRSAGYRTLMTGKWHLGMRPECHPLERGFDRYYGGLSGAFNYFKPGGQRGITDGRDPVETPDGWYATDAFTTRAIEDIDASLAEDADRPFFLYLAYNAPHWPLNAKVADFEKYRGQYRDGWAATAERRRAKQRAIGLDAAIEGDGQVDAADLVSPEWSSLSDKQRDRLDAVMAAYAGCLDSVDQNIGRLVDHLRETGELDDTLILFLSDNGACQEGGKNGKGNEAMVRNPPLETTDGVRLGLHWANACNTPFRLYKHYVHEGGACTPLIAHWPDVIPEDRRGGFATQLSYLPDVMATALDVSGGTYRKGVPKHAGRSLLPVLKGSDKPVHKQPIFFEHEGNAAMFQGAWKLVREYGKPWELYKYADDRTELYDLSDAKPDIRDRMAGRWEAWADSVGVMYPERFNMYEALKKQGQAAN